MKYFFDSIAAFVGATVGLLFGEWQPFLTCLLIFILIDYISGILAAFKEKRLSPHIGILGIGKKIMTLALIAVSHQLDIILGQTVIMTGGIFFYLVQELISINKNAAIIGLEVFPGLTQAISNINRKAGNSDGK